MAKKVRINENTLKRMVRECYNKVVAEQKKNRINESWLGNDKLDFLTNTWEEPEIAYNESEFEPVKRYNYWDIEKKVKGDAGDKWTWTPDDVEAIINAMKELEPTSYGTPDNFYQWDFQAKEGDEYIGHVNDIECGYDDWFKTPEDALIDAIGKIRNSEYGYNNGTLLISQYIKGQCNGSDTYTVKNGIPERSDFILKEGNFINNIKKNMNNRREKKANAQLGRLGLPNRLLRMYVFHSMEDGLSYYVVGRNGDTYEVWFPGGDIKVDKMNMFLDDTLRRNMVDITDEVGIDTNPNEFFANGDYTKIPFMGKDIDYK